MAVRPLRLRRSARLDTRGPLSLRTPSPPHAPSSSVTRKRGGRRIFLASRDRLLRVQPACAPALSRCAVLPACAPVFVLVSSRETSALIVRTTRRGPFSAQAHPRGRRRATREQPFNRRTERRLMHLVALEFDR